jgi:hypothetical protein
MNGVGGEAYAKTTFNHVTIEDVAGPITVDGQNVSVTAEPRKAARCQPITLSSTFGAMRVTLPAGVGYNIAARTTFGRVRSDHELTVTGDVSGTSLTGKIAGGGCEVKLTNQNGAVDILKAKI